MSALQGRDHVGSAHEVRSPVLMSCQSEVVAATVSAPSERAAPPGTAAALVGAPVMPVARGAIRRVGAAPDMPRPATRVPRARAEPGSACPVRAGPRKGAAPGSRVANTPPRTDGTPGAEIIGAPLISGRPPITGPSRGRPSSGAITMVAPPPAVATPSVEVETAPGPRKGDVPPACPRPRRIATVAREAAGARGGAAPLARSTSDRPRVITATVVAAAARDGAERKMAATVSPR